MGALAFWLIGMETRGRTIDEIEQALGAAPAAVPQAVASQTGN